MKVVILCGGMGTRLREETEFRPKPLVDVGGRPILWHILKMYAHYGFNEFVLCLGYRGNMIKEYFLNYEAMNNDFTICLGNRPQIAFHDGHKEQGYQITLADTGQNTMTGGRIKRIARYVDGDTFLVTYGDGLSDVNIPDLIKFHKGHGKTATLTTTKPRSSYGVLDVGERGQVRRFDEKPQLDSWINTGFFVFNRRLFDYLDGDECVLERAPLERLACEGQLMAFRHEGFFFCIDTYRDYKAINEMWDSGHAPWRLWK